MNAYVNMHSPTNHAHTYATDMRNKACDATGEWETAWYISIHTCTCKVSCCIPVPLHLYTTSLITPATALIDACSKLSVGLKGELKRKSKLFSMVQGWVVFEVIFG